MNSLWFDVFIYVLIGFIVLVVVGLFTLPHNFKPKKTNHYRTHYKWKDWWIR